MEKVLEQLASSKKNNLCLMIALGIFLGVQYSEFRSKLSRIEDRIAALEGRNMKVVSRE